MTYNICEGGNHVEMSSRFVALLVVRKFEQVSQRFVDASIKFESPGSCPPATKLQPLYQETHGNHAFFFYDWIK
jgi:hypothetical protein